MKPEETKKILKLIGGLFPMQVTSDQGKLLVDQISGLSFEAVEKAVREHRVSHDFFSTPKFIEGCRAAQHEKEMVTNTSAHEGSWSDVYRRQAPYLAGRSDIEVILRIHRGWWKRVGEAESYRRQFSASCAYRLVNTGMSLDVAEKFTESIFDPDPEYFQHVLDDLRTNVPVKSCA